jgi:hypothetical protein
MNRSLLAAAVAALILGTPEYTSRSGSMGTDSDRKVTRLEQMIAQYGRERVEGFIDPLLLVNNHVVAYYGHPNSKIMGIVGRLPREELLAALQEKGAAYDKLNGEKGVIPAIYLIYGTCQPGGNINIMKPEMVEAYIEFAIRNDALVILDHQIGRFPLRQAMEALLPYLRYPNVHLAIDVEWRTDRPMEKIGFIRGGELNVLQEMMLAYMADNDIPGRRMLIFHQFNYKMLRESSQVRVDYGPVHLVHTTSGWGKPKGKLATHARNAKVDTIPHKGFKLWLFYSKKKGVHYDWPLMTPEGVLALNPQPGLIIYQ